ncbi:hypothetical protein ASE90_03910 [Sphingomonas sp. Leaf67]|uniref:hypothetical protein n=1 Tax=unclassified Sphingomonas TaxID=196159 RepID=UPI0006FE88E3|nr:MULTISPECIES: hypothetical protein [unclassified Sphingomonas]KQN77666.1 hypothetical protein ASE91_14900 [Sphingomonas sp. Leaf62]KQN91917.1 hypothetical protein ASE90_03910 [Sphingomonas sp. Leaf67]
MKKTLLTSAALGLINAPVGAAETPLTIGVTMRGDAAARIDIEGVQFVLPDEQDAMSAALKALPDKDRPVTIAVLGKVAAPYRVIGGILYLTQSAGFTQVTVLNESPAD